MRKLFFMFRNFKRFGQPFKAYRILGEISFQQEDVQQALVRFEKALENADFILELEAYERATPPGHGQIRFYNELGMLYSQTNHLEEAAWAYRKAIETAPPDFTLFDLSGEPIRLSDYHGTYLSHDL